MGRRARLAASLFFVVLSAAAMVALVNAARPEGADSGAVAVATATPDGSARSAPAEPSVSAASPTVVAAAASPATPTAAPTATATATAAPTATTVPTPPATATPAPTATAVPTPPATATPAPTATKAPAPPPTATAPAPKPTVAKPRPPAPTATAPAPRPTAATRGGTRAQATSSDQQYTLDLHNQARAAHGAPPLVLDAAVSLAAQRKADDMAARGYFAHVGPDGKQPWDWLREAGAKFTAAGENLGTQTGGTDPAAPAIKRLFDMMMAETPPNDGHRVNILNGAYRKLGVGLARAAGDKLYWVCQFTD